MKSDQMFRLAPVEERTGIPSDRLALIEQPGSILLDYRHPKLLLQTAEAWQQSHSATTSHCGNLSGFDSFLVDGPKWAAEYFQSPKQGAKQIATSSNPREGLLLLQGMLLLSCLFAIASSVPASTHSQTLPSSS